MTTYPQQYLHVRECSSGQEWIMPLTSRARLDLRTQLKRWIKREFAGELRLDGKIMPRIDGDYYAQIMTEGRPPDSCVCWESGGFYLVSPEMHP
jgi:hypothetical protein